MLKKGDKIRIIKGIYDDGEDHHPPQWLAQAGDVVEVIESFPRKTLVTFGEDLRGSFWVITDEFEVI